MISCAKQQSRLGEAGRGPRSSPLLVLASPGSCSEILSSVLCAAAAAAAVAAMYPAGTGVADSLLRKKEQKDEELDRRIVALRRKNQALLRRYQEIEEDRRQAEQGGMAVTAPRPHRTDGLTITITKAHSEKRVVCDRRASSHPNSPGAKNEEELGELEEEEDEEDHTFTFRLGKRVQLAVTMENKAKGKRIVSTKVMDQDEEGPSRGGSNLGSPMQIAITMDPGQKAMGLGSHELGRDYARWKQEREQIDLARLARHRDAQGEWRRPWDLDKSIHTFQDTSKVGNLSFPMGSRKKGPKNYRKFQLRPLLPDERGGGAYSGNLGKPKVVPAMSSKARGKDRLTGRARRWDMKEAEEQTCLKLDLESQGPHKTKRTQNEEDDTQKLGSLEHSDYCSVLGPIPGLASLDGHQREEDKLSSGNPVSTLEPRSSRKIAPVLPFFSPEDANSPAPRASGSNKPTTRASVKEIHLFFPDTSEQAQKLSDDMAELCLQEIPELQKTSSPEPSEDGSDQTSIQEQLDTVTQSIQKSQPEEESDESCDEQDQD
ncbi:coiled-coil domain-containing protein 9B isoform X1 [Monodelphis domestica]|uniref:coiled-coil domain-containing protein 9B isoform X1 n=2 Tax=Monodelphis domestica TaxID=13616 RepID=UPI0004431FC0|nr:coiled-coil domain-containing protein 9B isoform X1 [Monodelphis domestica]